MGRIFAGILHAFSCGVFGGHITKMRSWTEYDVDVFLRMKAKATAIMLCLKNNKIITE